MRVAVVEQQRVQIELEQGCYVRGGGDIDTV